ncbi:hypothetical protein ACH5RR_019618 [Cinchona calisaya]|uniref:Uncharacterized protein n=1 Tax=Cinchona calisaya TaxID=153742 RepID=A0ABD2ZQ19_9GENT
MVDRKKKRAPVGKWSGGRAGMREGGMWLIWEWVVDLGMEIGASGSGNGDGRLAEVGGKRRSSLGSGRFRVLVAKCLAGAKKRLKMIHELVKRPMFLQQRSMTELLADEKPPTFRLPSVASDPGSSQGQDMISLISGALIFYVNWSSVLPHSSGKTGVAVMLYDQRRSNISKIEREWGVMFELVSAPQPPDIAEAAGAEAAKKFPQFLTGQESAGGISLDVVKLLPRLQDTDQIRTARFGSGSSLVAFLIGEEGVVVRFVGEEASSLIA